MTPPDDLERAGEHVDLATAEQQAALTDRLPRSRFARMRDVGDDRIMTLELEDRDQAELELHLGRRGQGGTIEVRLRDRQGHHVGVRISERELRAIAITATAALAWIAPAPS